LKGKRPTVLPKTIWCNQVPEDSRGKEVSGKKLKREHCGKTEDTIDHETINTYMIYMMPEEDDADSHWTINTPLI
jgi:hypothetical protein